MRGPLRKRARWGIIPILLLLGTALSLAFPVHGAVHSKLFIERPTPDQRVASIESANGTTIASVDWQLCPDATGVNCGQVSSNHTTTENFDGLFLSGVVSTTVTYADPVSNPAEQLKAILPNPSSVGYNHSPVNRGQPVIAVLNSSQTGILQGTRWELNGLLVQEFVTPVAELEVATNNLPVGNNALLVTETWFDASGITSYYRTRSTLQVQPMPLGTIECSPGSAVNVICEATRPPQLPADPNETVLWNSDGLVQSGSAGPLYLIFKYAPGDYHITVEGRIPDESAQGYYVTWHAETDFKVYPQGTTACLTQDVTYQCTGTSPVGAESAATFDWSWVTTARLGPPTQETHPAGQPLVIPRQCGGLGGIVWLTAKNAAGEIVWVVFGTIINDTGGCSMLPLVGR